ncbi:MAG: Fpg/Nei family DNA glycosylase [Actinomycetes bacterium]
MPEGHTLHRLARRFRAQMGGRRVRASSPQGRFVEGAALLDGAVLVRTEAHGKQLFLGFSRDGGRPELWLRVHLGLYGAWTFGDLGPEGEPPEPRGAVRLRLVGDDVYADLRGPTRCEVVTTAEKSVVHERLGVDPLARRPDPAPFLARVGRSSAPIGTLLMDQSVVAGVGNVYRAESLFRAGLSPFVPGRELPAHVVQALWDDVVRLMRDGLRRGRIITVDPSERPRRPGPDDAFYVYRRAGLPCRRCGTTVARREVGGRNLYWCPTCQA